MELIVLMNLKRLAMQRTLVEAQQPTTAETAEAEDKQDQNTDKSNNCIEHLIRK